MLKENNYNDIELIKVLVKVWKEKIKILYAILISLLFATIYIINDDDIREITFISKLEPISFLEENEYSVLNEIIKYSKINEMRHNYATGNELPTMSEMQNHYSTGLYVTQKFEINSLMLWQLFSKILEDKLVLEKSIIDSKIIDVKDYKDKISLNNAIKEFSRDITLHNVFDKYPDNMSDYHINVKHNDAERVKTFLQLYQKNINKYVQKILIERFNAYLSNLDELYGFIIEDLDANILEEEEKFRDLKQRNLNNLYEHLDTAKALNVKEISKDVNLLFNLIEPTDSNEIYPRVGNEKLILDYDNQSYYLMGYVFIEKKIDQIKKILKEDKLLSTNALIIDKKKRDLSDKKITSRLNTVFKQSPLSNYEVFKAAYFDLDSSEIFLSRYRITPFRAIILSIVIGIFLGLLYIMTFDAIRGFFIEFYKKLSEKN